MAKLEINIPIEIIEAEITEHYGAAYPMEIQDIYFDAMSSDLVLRVYIDDEDVTEDNVHNWNVTTTMDFVKGIL